MSISGKRIRLKVTGVVVEGYYRHGGRGKAQELSRATGRDLGYANFDAGLLEMRLTASLYIDLTDGIGVDIQEGDVLEDVEVYRHDADATPAVVMPEALVVSANEQGEVEGKLEYEIELVNKGPYTRSTPGFDLR